MHSDASIDDGADCVEKYDKYEKYEKYDIFKKVHTIWFVYIQFD